MTTRTRTGTRLVLILLVALAAIALLLRQRPEAGSATTSTHPVVAEAGPAVGLKPRDMPNALPAPSSTPSPASRDILLVVRAAEDQQPISGARICTASGIVVGTTDDEGRAALSALGRGRLLVRKAGYRLVWIAESSLVAARTRGDLRHQVRVELTRGAHLGGRVRVMPGASVPAKPLRVMAWPWGEHPPTSAQVDRALAGSPEILVMETDAKGEFRFDEVDPEAWYRLYVAGGGYAAKGPPIEVRPSPETLSIEAYPLYAVVLQALDQDGRALPSYAPLYPDQMPSLGSGGAFEPTLAADHVARLAGAPRPNDDAASVWWGTADIDADRVEAGNAHVRFPGYERVIARVWAYRATAGSLRVNRIRMRRLADPHLGSLSIEAKIPRLQERERPSEVDRPELFATVNLILQDILPGGSPGFVIGLSEPPSKPAVVERLPVGRYVGLIRPIRPMGFRQRRLEFEVKPDSRTHVIFKPENWGCIELSLGLDKIAQPLHHPVFVTFRWTETIGLDPGPRETTLHLFPGRPPLRMDGILAREYQVEWSVNGREVEPRPLVVEAGQIHDVTIELAGVHAK